MRRAFADLDGVLTNFDKAAIALHGLHAETRDWPNYHCDLYDFLKDKLGMTKQEFYDGMDEDFWADLEWMPDGQLILDLIEQAFGAENVCILTSAIDGPGCYDGKHRWLRRNLPEYHDRCLVGSPKYMCAGDDNWLFDDRHKHVDTFTKAGGTGILVPRHWNRHWDHDTVPFLRRVLGA